jgi:hypothetical protein
VTTQRTGAEEYEACKAVVREVYPEIGEDETWDFLVNCTPYPCAGEDHVRDSLVEMRRLTGGDVRLVYLYSDALCDPAVTREDAARIAREQLAAIDEKAVAN